LLLGHYGPTLTAMGADGGPVPPNAGELGRTLIHEHVLVGFPGLGSRRQGGPPFKPRRDNGARRRSDADARRSRPRGTFVDPCPMDLGRDVEFPRRALAAQRHAESCATTGGYFEAEGITYTFSPPSGRGDHRHLHQGDHRGAWGETGIKAGRGPRSRPGPGHVSDYGAQSSSTAGARAGGRGDRACPLISHTQNAFLRATIRSTIVNRRGRERRAPRRRPLRWGSDDQDYHRSPRRSAAHSFRFSIASGSSVIIPRTRCECENVIPRWPRCLGIPVASCCRPRLRSSCWRGPSRYPYANSYEEAAGPHAGMAADVESLETIVPQLRAGGLSAAGRRDDPRTQSVPAVRPRRSDQRARAARARPQPQSDSGQLGRIARACACLVGRSWRVRREHDVGTRQVEVCVVTTGARGGTAFLEGGGPPPRVGG